ncbi:VC2046/SO_2500 family protein [Pseudoalteromonas tunicata]|jgi:hypothetical protein|uniref:QueD like 2 n=1 Tax=Pseudoalteromonas tunicata D2 TaxID=87626 RepID=A4CBU2_9GAMM|nr:VC2046/SO_2500 family protein [Pseudoalteromonas tunicata]ATC94383.1 hypothetical protein PTUN_a1802 [Pseudoalteromonas tunicata]AXT30121.1 queD like 2 [Pseudoalteromonas tunicata]EAR27829.1 hypothetical protein PTD2_18445 [Pseudoalteromonas tunicata D2]MDP5211604.1 VC2046/SO_2500 family protein [Pseudoalteromonas tunicata]
MQIDGILTNEIQLGNKLGVCISENRRSDFALLLSMLSADPLDFAQFHLPYEEKKPAYGTQADNEDLRLKLGAGPLQALAVKPIDFLIGAENAAMVQEQGLAQLKLQTYLNPEPLAIRDDKDYISSDIISNCNLNVQKRYFSQTEPLSHLSMNAAQFYNDLTHPDLHRPLAVTQA